SRKGRQPDLHHARRSARSRRTIHGVRPRHRRRGRSSTNPARRFDHADIRARVAVLLDSAAMRARIVAAATTALLLAPLGARGQDDPKVGLTTGVPGAGGVIWQMSNHVALRPEFTWTRTSIDLPSTTDPVAGTITTSATSDNWQTGVGLSA